MRKSIYQRENEILRALLRSWREDAGMVQEQVLHTANHLDGATK